jgi:hypothetical protein
MRSPLLDAAEGYSLSAELLETFSERPVSTHSRSHPMFVSSYERPEARIIGPG